MATAERYPIDVGQRVADRLGESGVRLTAGRRAVVDAMSRSTGPMTASGIGGVLDPRVPVSSLYRTLAVLSEAGVLNRTFDGDGVARYELAEWLSGHHHHLVCLACGRVEDLHTEPGLESELQRLIAEVAARRGMTVAGHRVEIEGMCATCHP